MKVTIHIALSLLFLISCNSKEDQKEEIKESTQFSFSATSKKELGKEKLSDYNFFKGKLADLTPQANVIPYNLNSPLFSDYAHKARFVKFPDGQSADYHNTEVLSFPKGTILIKNFYYPTDFNKPDGARRIIETRLLINEAKGWKALPYVWNDEQTEATLQLTGATKSVSWKDKTGAAKKLMYSVPNMNQCRSCHLYNDKIMPIGPTARQLNGTLTYDDGNSHNQLAHWAAEGFLKGMPTAGELPKLVSYNNSGALINERARAYLEINCGHCHRKEGPAKNSALELLSAVDNPAAWGVGKTPIAAGKGSGGLKYDILPGQPEQSIMAYRMNSTDPGIMMPELGRKMIHKEGVALVETVDS